jgi:CarD family transcriptional regulator
MATKSVKSSAKKSTKKVETKKIEEKKTSNESIAKAILDKKEQRKNKEADNNREFKINEIDTPALDKKLKELENKKVTFKKGDYAIYPSHGVGKIIDIEKTTIMDQEISCYIMLFEKEKLTIKIPATSAGKIGMRHLINKEEMDEVFIILRSGVKKLKGMWSRRAQEYETKINSGDIVLLAEVLRDLTRDIEDAERSYSERIIYETAIYRLASEYAIIYGIDVVDAEKKVTITAKDKLNAEGFINQKDEFDDFDDFDEEEDEEDEESDEIEEEEEEDDDY